MENYRDMLIMNYFIISDTLRNLFTAGMNLSLLDELKDLKGHLDEPIELQIDILDTMNDPLVRRIAEVLYKIKMVLETLQNINAFTDDELTAGGQEETCLPTGQEPRKAAMLY